jgi:hypothetical protein
MNVKQTWILMALCALTVFLWSTPVLFPVKVFVVMLHETGHAAAAVLTGGEIERIELSRDLGGACWSRGGWRLLVLPAGYLGSMAFGGLILLAAARMRRDSRLAVVLGLAVLAITLLLVRTLFGVLFGLGFGIVLLASARWLPDAVNDLLLKFLGMASVLYAAIDIKEDLIDRTVPGSDAYAMSRELFLPPVFWGALWMALALGAAGLFLKLATARPRSAESSVSSSMD